MSLDSKITQAVDAAVAKAGQPEQLARRIRAWLEAVTSGNEDIHDTSSAGRHLDALYEQTQCVSKKGESDDG